jgi:hypothetical protein
VDLDAADDRVLVDVADREDLHPAGVGDGGAERGRGREGEAEGGHGTV